MPKILRLSVKAGAASHSLSLSYRDVHLLDGQRFFRDGWVYRKLFGLDFIRGLKKQPPLPIHKRAAFLIQLQSLLVELETQRDLPSFDYSYGFADEPKVRHGGAMSGFRVEGGTGFITVRPAGYCDLTISDQGPNGRGRAIAMIDMRVRREYETLDRGKLRVYARKASVGWFAELESLVAFVKESTNETVEIVEPHDPI